MGLVVSLTSPAFTHRTPLSRILAGGLKALFEQITHADQGGLPACHGRKATGRGQLEVTKATTALGQLATGFKTRGNLSCLNSRTALAAN
jgi:hypothetical protein